MIYRAFIVALLVGLLVVASGCATVSPEEMAEQIEINDQLKDQLAEAQKQLKVARAVTQRLAARLTQLRELDRMLKEYLEQLFGLTE